MANALDNFLGQDEYIWLRREFLRPDPDQDRKDWTSPARIEAVQTIVASATQIVDGKPFGIREPLVVTKLGYNDYLIISGETRWRAAGEGNIELLPCIVRNSQTGAATLSLEALIINIQRDDLNIWERSLALQKRLDGDSAKQIPPMSMDELSAALNRSKPWISKYTAVLKMPEALQALCREGLVGNVDTLRDLASYNETDMQQAIDDIRNGANANQLIKERPKKKPKRTTATEPDNNLVTTNENAQQSNSISITMTLNQAVNLLNRIGIFEPDQSSPDALKAQLMAEVTGVY